MLSPRSPRAQLALVDDDPAVRHALTFAFDTAGLRLIAFADAEAALAAPGRGEWLCLIIDEKLPGLSGLDFLDVLRREGFRAPAILITSNPPAALRQRAGGAGVEIVEKPLLDEELSHKVLSLIGRA